jgi:hypothetical protein
MIGEMSCEQVRDLAPEIALDIVAGEERSPALRHLGICPDCRRLVSELSEVSDELLLRAPVHQPPMGFKSRVLAAIGEPSGRKRFGLRSHSSRWVAAAATAVLLAGALGGGAAFLATADDRRLADGYRATLTEGQGSFFTAAALEGPQGRVGTVFGYEGRPSWVMVTLQPPMQEGRAFEIRVITLEGRYLALGEAALGGDNEALGREIPVDLSEVQELQLVGPGGRIVYTATFDPIGPWD